MTRQTPSPTATAEAWVDLILGSADPADNLDGHLRPAARLGAVQPRCRGNPPRNDCSRPAAGRNCLGSLAGVPPLSPQASSANSSKFWVSCGGGSGTAVLILDGLSLRELPLIVAAGQQRGLAPARVEVRGSEVPTETDRFAEALGAAKPLEALQQQGPRHVRLCRDRTCTPTCSTPRSPIASDRFQPSPGCSSGTSGPTSR